MPMILRGGEYNDKLLSACPDWYVERMRADTTNDGWRWGMLNPLEQEEVLNECKRRELEQIKAKAGRGLETASAALQRKISVLSAALNEKKALLASAQRQRDIDRLNFDCDELTKQLGEAEVELRAGSLVDAEVAKSAPTSKARSVPKSKSDE